MLTFDEFRQPGSHAQPADAWAARIDAEQRAADAVARLYTQLDADIRMAPFHTAADRPMTTPQPLRRQAGTRIGQQVAWDDGGLWLQRIAAAAAGGMDFVQVILPAGAQLSVAQWQQAAVQIAVEAFSADGSATLPAEVSLVSAGWLQTVWDAAAEAPTTAPAVLSASELAAAGASAVEELAAAAWAQQQAPHAAVQFSVGREYLVDIAKLRAARVLLGEGVAVHAAFHPFHMARKAPENNLLRITTAAMAAMAGGADQISLPHHNVWRSPADADADRWARGILLLLRHEAHLDAVADPAAGSYTLEWLTSQFVNAARDLLGQMAELPSTAEQAARLRQQIQATALARAATLAQGERPFVGATRYPKPGDDTPEANPNERLQPHTDRLVAWRAAAEAAEAVGARPPAQ